MKTFFRISITLVFFLSSNKINAQESGDRIFGIKSGKMTYSYNSSSEDAFMTAYYFDYYGKLFRSESNFNENNATIWDFTAGKEYDLLESTKKYIEDTIKILPAFFSVNIYLGDDKNCEWETGKWTVNGLLEFDIFDFKRLPNRFIFGKECTSCTFRYKVEDEWYIMEWGGWNRITFWKQAYKEGSDPRIYWGSSELVSFSETVTADYLTIPPDYTRITPDYKIIPLKDVN